MCRCWRAARGPARLSFGDLGGSSLRIPHPVPPSLTPGPPWPSPGGVGSIKPETARSLHGSFLDPRAGSGARHTGTRGTPGSRFLFAARPYVSFPGSPGPRATQAWLRERSPAPQRQAGSPALSRAAPVNRAASETRLPAPTSKDNREGPCFCLSRSKTKQGKPPPATVKYFYFPRPWPVMCPRGSTIFPSLLTGDNE